MSDDYLANMRGTKLSHDEFKNQVLSVTTYPEIQYRWATGVAITKFLQGLKEGRIIGSRCDDCTRVVCPPRIFCEECFNPMNEFVDLPDTGTINTFSLAYINTDASRRDFAEIPAVIDIDGTTISPSGFLHMVDEDIDHNDLEIGMKVKAVWEDEDKRKGDITDIKYFELLED